MRTTLQTIGERAAAIYYYYCPVVDCNKKPVHGNRVLVDDCKVDRKWVAELCNKHYKNVQDGYKVI